MAEPECPGCRERDARIDALERRIADLQARLNTHASNSSTPPSANPLGAKPLVVKKKSKRQRGAQHGHPPHLKQLLPPERVTHTEFILPQRCDHCQASLPQQAEPNDPELKRFQVVELPPLVVQVVEYQAHARTCPCCGGVTQATIPATIRAHSVGPRLTATLSYFSGCHGVSKRGVEEIAETVFTVPLALGTVSHLEQEVSAALEPAHREALEAVRQADVKFADETGWKRWGKLCWLWAAATTSVAVFVVHAKRSAQGLAALLGETIDGIVHSDRWHVYKQIPEERRQLCWAHLKRDFQKVVDGERRLGKTLLQGAFDDDARVATFCENLISLEPALWLLAKREGVEPTNNCMERLVRRAVLWRRRSFGCNSDGGRFVERILTVVQTCRLKARNTLEYRTLAVQAKRFGQECPKLLG